MNKNDKIYTNNYPNKQNEIQLQIIEIIKENPTILKLKRIKGRKNV